VKVIKNWGIERREFEDPLTGRREWQLTNNQAPSAHFYFTRSSWVEGWPRPFFISDRGGAVNLFTFDEAWSVLQLTDMPPVGGEKYWTSYDGKTFFRAPLLAAGFMGATADPLGGGLYFSSGFEEGHLMRYDFGTGAVERVLDNAAGCITTDGKYSLHVHFEDDHEQKIRHTRLFQSVLGTGETELICEDDGDFAHMLCSPVDPESVIWINYHRRKGMKYNPRTKELGTWIEWQDPHTYFHYSFLPKSSLILIAHRGSKPCAASGTGGNEILWTIQDETSKVLEHLEAWDPWNMSHATASHDHMLVVSDSPRHDYYSEFKPEDVTNQIHLFDRRTGQTSPLCACNTSFISRDEKGRWVYCEYLHPRPVFSPDDRFVLFDSDFRSFTGQVYMVEL